MRRRCRRHPRPPVRAPRTRPPPPRTGTSPRATSWSVTPPAACWPSTRCLPTHGRSRPWPPRWRREPASGSRAPWRRPPTSRTSSGPPTGRPAPRHQPPAGCRCSSSPRSARWSRAPWRDAAWTAGTGRYLPSWGRSWTARASQRSATPTADGSTATPSGPRRRPDAVHPLDVAALGPDGNATASATRRTSRTPHTPRPHTCAPGAATWPSPPACGRRSCPTTTPRPTSPTSCAS